MNDTQKYFLNYQREWLRDKSKIKLWEKSRRIGATYTQSYEDVDDAIKKAVPSVWFTSADLSAAREYIDYCAQWIKLFHTAAQSLGEQVIDSEQDIKAFVIELANGVKIHAISSNPKAFRSKGGKVILDEFAWHDDQDKLWAAARPVITWGYPLRILSTHNGQTNMFYKFIQDIKKGRLNWSLHTTTIRQAVEDGLLDKILKRKATQKERASWLEEEHANCYDENTWMQEYCCQAVDETQAFLTYDMITSCESDVLRSLDGISNPLYVGVDIGRKKDLTVIWVVESVGKVKFTRLVKVLEKAPFRVQREALFSIFKHKQFRRACIDATGLGMQLAEEAEESFGKYRVEGLMFSETVKEELASPLRAEFEDRTFWIPPDHDIREDLHSIRRFTTKSQHIRFDVAASDVNGHADRFWAAALANHAAKRSYTGIPYIASGSRREATKLVQNY